MPRVKAKAERITASLLEVQANPEMYWEQVVWVPTLEVLDAHHPENPRTHKLDTDVPKTFKSLLWYGWGEVGITFNPATGRITGGHGRSMAAHLGMEKSPEDFDVLWERWLRESKARKAIADNARPRFSPDYWHYCPLYVCLLTEDDQRTLMVRLNNDDSDGKDDPARMALLLARIPKAQIEDTGWDPLSAQAFKTAFLERTPEPEPDEPEGPDAGYQFDAGMDDEGGTDYEPGQRFERPDATDYGDDDDYEDDDAFDESEPVTVTTADGETVWVADTGELAEDFENNRVTYDKDTRETRAVLLMSRVQLDEFKSFFGTTAQPGPVVWLLEKLGFSVDMNQSIKEWRPDANLAVLKAFVKQNQALYDDYLAQQSKPSSSEEE
jgi:DNA-binding beta-propeller fold protein YncE